MQRLVLLLGILALWIAAAVPASATATFDPGPFDNTGIGEVDGDCVDVTCVIAKRFDQLDRLWFALDVDTRGQAITLNELIQNNTAETWTDYHIRISCGDTGCGNFSFVSFTSAGPFALPAAGLFPLTGVDDVTLTLAGGTVAPGEIFALQFVARNDDGFGFAVRQEPSIDAAVVPEPSPLLLLGLGIGGLGLRRRRGRR